MSVAREAWFTVNWRLRSSVFCTFRLREKHIGYNHVVFFDTGVTTAEISRMGQRITEVETSGNFSLT
ncbi:hypothetical protein PCI56_05620 [Plesiomonas shigelloides subsp. oncorhynchi]|nr:hypothetical protein [Plesiomonas shigelloides]